MIYDKLENIEKYRGISRWLDAAVDFLVKTDLDSLPLGRTEICGDKVFANVMEARASEEGKFEIHKKYMDIQIDLKGVEKIQIGLDTGESIDVFSEEKDFGTVSCELSADCVMGRGRFIVCMAEEPHRPGMAAGADRDLKKCVIKVAAV